MLVLLLQLHAAILLVCLSLVPAGLDLLAVAASTIVLQIVFVVDSIFDQVRDSFKMNIFFCPAANPQTASMVGGYCVPSPKHYEFRFPTFDVVELLLAMSISVAPVLAFQGNSCRQGKGSENRADLWQRPMPSLRHV